MTTDDDVMGKAREFILQNWNRVFTNFQVLEAGGDEIPLARFLTDFARQQLAERQDGWVAELLTVFKRNIAMHQNSPVLASGNFTDEVRAELRGFIRGLQRGLEIVDMSQAEARAENTELNPRKIAENMPIPPYRPAGDGEGK